MYVLLWEFLVRAECEAEFQAIYGPQGEWVRLFRHSPGYQRTELLQEANGGLRYLTLDYWTSRQAYEQFQREHQAEYQALDECCTDLTQKETRVGEFDIVS